MQPQFLFPVLSIIFLLLAVLRIGRDKRIQPASKTWLILSILFGLVGGYLWWHAS